MDATYTNETIVNLPRDATVLLYVDIRFFPKWQPNFISHKFVDGKSSNEIEVAEVCYNIAGKTLTFIREVLKSDMPEKITATFEIEGIRQDVISEFVVIDENQSKLVSTVTISSEAEYTPAQFAQVASIFKAQTAFMQNNFKKFAESI